MRFNPALLAEQIYLQTNSAGIITTNICLTRLRLKLANYTNLDLDKLKSLSGVLDVVVADDQLQIVLGPGKVSQVYRHFSQYSPTQLVTNLPDQKTDVANSLNSFDPRALAEAIYLATYQAKIIHVTICMTRFRLNVLDIAKIDLVHLSNLLGVLDAVIVDKQLQIILGTGRVVKVYECFKLLLADHTPSIVNSNI